MLLLLLLLMLLLLLLLLLVRLLLLPHLLLLPPLLPLLLVLLLLLSLLLLPLLLLLLLLLLSPLLPMLLLLPRDTAAVQTSTMNKVEVPKHNKPSWRGRGVPLSQGVLNHGDIMLIVAGMHIHTNQVKFLAAPQDRDAQEPAGSGKP
jgi:hypothetical protein